MAKSWHQRKSVMAVMKTYQAKYLAYRNGAIMAKKASETQSEEAYRRRTKMKIMAIKLKIMAHRKYKQHMARWRKHQMAISRGFSWHQPAKAALHAKAGVASGESGEIESWKLCQLAWWRRKLWPAMIISFSGEKCSLCLISRQAAESVAGGALFWHQYCRKKMKKLFVCSNRSEIMKLLGNINESRKYRLTLIYSEKKAKKMAKRNVREMKRK